MTGALFGKLESWVVGSVSLLPNLVVAALVVALALLVGRLVFRGARAAIGRTSQNLQLVYLGATLARAAVWIGGLVVALSVLGLDQAVASMLAGVGVLGIVLGFAFQDTGANFVSGVMMAVREPFRIGEVIRTGAHIGIVEAVDLRATTLRQFTGERVQVPNKDVFGNPIENLSSFGRRRIDLPIGVSYASDLDHVLEVTAAAAASVEGRIADQPPEVLFTGFGDSAIELVVRVWAPYGPNFDWLTVRSDLVRAVFAAYRAAEISIPFPIRTLDLGVREGVALATALADDRASPSDDPS